MNQNENKQEQELLEYWYSITNDPRNPASKPFKIRITQMNQETINYEKLNNYNKVIGIGCIQKKEIEYYRKLTNEYSPKKISFEPH